MTITVIDPTGKRLILSGTAVVMDMEDGEVADHSRMDDRMIVYTGMSKDEALDELRGATVNLTLPVDSPKPSRTP